MRLSRTAAAAIAGTAIVFGSLGSVGMAAPRKKDLVLVGTIFSITQGGSDRKPWIVTIDVEKVVSGDFSGKTFEFAVHSPSISGLQEGHSYTIKATWKGGGYDVDELQWIPLRKVRGAGALLECGTAESRVAADTAAPGR